MIGAKKGDVIVMDRPYNQRGMIIGVYTADGSPPYLVRWCDDARETLFMAGPTTTLVRSPVALRKRAADPTAVDAPTAPPAAPPTAGLDAHNVDPYPTPPPARPAPTTAPAGAELTGRSVATIGLTR